MAMDIEGVDRLVSEMKPPLHNLRQLHDSSFLQEQGANPELGSRNLLPNSINCEEGEFSSRIPEELLLRIFRDALPPSWTAYFGRTRPPFPRAVWSSDFETKLTLIQVCKRWYRIGLEFLYESVSLKSIGQLAVFSLALENSSHVGSLVQRLEICYWVPRGYHTLHDTELAKTLEHCSRLKYLAFNPQVASNPPFEIFLPKFPPIPKNLDPWTITHFDICDDVPYRSIIPVLLHLSSTLQSLSIALPTEYGPDHVMITFPRVHSLRLSIARESIQPGAYWAFPYLQQLLLSPSPCLRTEWPFSLAATAFLGKYGRTLRTLCLGKANDNHTLKELLVHCPMLQYLTLAEHWLPPQAYCCHEKLQSLDVYSDSSYRDPSHWPTMFPSLRSSRRVDISHDLYPSLPAVQGSDTQLDYSLPARSYLEFLLAEGDDTEVNEDSDYQFDEDSDESGGTDTSNLGSDSEGDSDSSYPDSPFTEGNDDWEVEREEAIEIFRRLVM